MSKDKKLRDVELDLQAALRAEYRQAVAELLAAGAAFEAANTAAQEIFARARDQGIGLPPVCRTDFVLVGERSIENVSPNALDAIRLAAANVDIELLDVSDPIRIRLGA